MRLRVLCVVTMPSGLYLHPLQIQIALRGAYLLRVGGHMVYSTCTFNPVENEAVVAEILRQVSSHEATVFSRFGSVWFDAAGN